jgi:hypothetical protein
MTHRIRLIFACAAALLVMLAAVPAQAQNLSTSNYALNITGQMGFATTTFGFGYSYTGYDMPEYHDFTNPNVAVQVHTIDLMGSYAILPNRLSVGVDLSMEIMAGDRSDFAFGHFGLSTVYTFFNSRMAFASVGLGVKLLNQSLRNTFSPDELFFRPYVVTGVTVWRLYFTPYVGVPIFIDINSDNDPGDNLQNCGPGTCYPDRHPNYWQDDNPFGLDYGVPIGLRVISNFYLTVEPTGMTWLYPNHITTLWVTPGVMWQGSPIVAGVGLKMRVYTTDSAAEKEDFWQLVFSAGVYF